MDNRISLCISCAEKADFGGQTGQRLHIPEKYTCEGCGQDVLFIVHTPSNRLLRLSVKLAKEYQDEQTSITNK